MIGLILSITGFAALFMAIWILHKPLAEEWWHFTLADEPYPDTYFDFSVREEGKGKREE